MEQKINLVIDKDLGAVSREDVFALEGKAMNGIEEEVNSLSSDAKQIIGTLVKIIKTSKSAQ